MIFYPNSNHTDLDFVNSDQPLINQTTLTLYNLIQSRISNGNKDSIREGGER